VTASAGDCKSRTCLVFATICSPHPCPLPQGEGASPAAQPITGAAWNCRNAVFASPSSLRERAGEGERALESEDVRDFCDWLSAFGFRTSSRFAGFRISDSHLTPHAFRFTCGSCRFSARCEAQCEKPRFCHWRTCSAWEKQCALLCQNVCG